MNEILSGPNAGPAAEWERLRPVIDDALHALGERDREAVLLRFFEGRAFADVGAKLFLSEDAARMRVERALEKLRAALVRRGITSTTAALGVALANQAAATAPAGVAASVTGAALAGAASASGAASAAAILMSMTKLQAGIISALAVAGVTGFGLQAQSNAALRDEIARLQQESPVIAPLRAENRRLARTAAEIVELRKDDAVLAQLRDEARELKDRLQAVMHAAKTADTGVTPTPLTGEVFDVKKIDRPPKPAFQARPVYPTEMRKAATSGEVTVDFIVDAAGMVHNVVAIKSSQREFEASAVEAVSHWEFEPGQKDGRAVNTHMMTRIVFTWEKKAAAPDTGQPKTENNKPAPAPWF